MANNKHEKFNSAEFLSGTIAPKEGVFFAIVDAMASNDPVRVANASNDCLSGLSDVGSMLRVFADYLCIREANPSEHTFASDKDLAESLYTLSDLVSLCHGAMGNGVLKAIDFNQKTSKEG